MQMFQVTENRTANISYPQVRQPMFSVGIFPLNLFLGLTGNRPQSAPACSFLRNNSFQDREFQARYNGQLPGLAHGRIRFK
jgi:hypothetical protein